MPWGPRASFCLRSLRAGLGTEFPVASKGAEPSSSQGGHRQRESRPGPTARCQKRKAALVSGPGLMEPGQCGARPFWEPCAGISLLCQLHRRAPETTCRTKSPGTVWKARGLERGRGKCRGASLPGPGNFCLPGDVSSARKSQGPRLSPRLSCGSHPPGCRARVCRPGVLARCVSAILRPRPRGKDPHCPRFTNGINKAEDSEQLAGDEGGLEKPVSFPGPSLGSLFVPLFACFLGLN